MQSSKSKFAYVGGVKSGAFAFVFCTIGTLLLALFAKLFMLGGNVLVVVNQVVKVAAIVLSTALFVKENALLPKAVVGAFVYWLLCLICFAIAGGSIGIGKLVLDLVIYVAAAIVVVLIKNRR